MTLIADRSAARRADQVRHDTWVAGIQSAKSGLFTEARLIKFVQRWPKLIEVLTESFVCDTVVGDLGPPGGYDVLTRDKHRLEVKFARLHTVVRDGMPTATRRWDWTEVFGGRGKKEFDGLVLLGQPDDRYADQQSSPFVIFLVPYAEVKGLCVMRRSVRQNRICSTTNRDTVRAAGVKLFDKYRVDEETLAMRCRECLQAGG